MTWRSLICFSFAVSAAAGPARGAALSGTVVLKDSRVEAVNKRKDFSGVVVSARPVTDAAPVPARGHATMEQKGKMFIPHVLPVEAGTVVDFPNLDPIFHSAFSSYSGQI